MHNASNIPLSLVFVIGVTLFDQPYKLQSSDYSNLKRFLLLPSIILTSLFLTPPFMLFFQEEKPSFTITGNKKDSHL
jgi:hypothetical protein